MPASCARESPHSEPGTRAASPWHLAVRTLRSDDAAVETVLRSYLDLPVHGAAARFAKSEEFREASRVLGEPLMRHVLDYGAGNGIASYALARGGWRVTAYEPDESDEVGAGAIRGLAAWAGLPIRVESGPDNPGLFRDGEFDAVYVRQVLHHLPSLREGVRNLARVVAPRGRLLIVREHVIDDSESLRVFRDQHPLHRLFGGENAYRLAEYLAAFRDAGLRVARVWGPLETVINYYPGTEAERRAFVGNLLGRRLGRVGHWAGRVSAVREAAACVASRRDRTPGRLFSFLLEKP
jgi:SAM-dependent methyltransferase